MNIFLLGVVFLLLFTITRCVSGQPTEELANAAPVETEQATLTPTKVPTETKEIEAPSEEPEEAEETEDSGNDDAASSNQAFACVGGHTDQVKLIYTADPIEEVESENEGVRGSDEVARLEPGEKVLIDLEALSEDKHSSRTCTNCHGVKKRLIRIQLTRIWFPIPV